MPSSAKFTHFDNRGQAHMVDVGDKDITERVAIAEGCIAMQKETLELIDSDGHKKGDVLGIARTAAIMAAKRTSELIPLCHPLMLTHVSVELVPDHEKNIVHCTATTKTAERTGVEMEALVAVQVALLTIYDMCKAVDRGMEIFAVRLDYKRGGKSGIWQRQT